LVLKPYRQLDKLGQETSIESKRNQGWGWSTKQSGHRISSGSTFQPNPDALVAPSSEGEGQAKYLSLSLHAYPSIAELNPVALYSPLYIINSCLTSNSVLRRVHVDRYLC